MTTLSSRKMAGTHVLTQDGHDIGQVHGLEIDAETWRVKAVEVRLHRRILDALGLPKPLLGAPTVVLPIKEVAGCSEHLVLQEPLEDLALADPALVKAAKARKKAAQG